MAGRCKQGITEEMKPGNINFNEKRNVTYFSVILYKYEVYRKVPGLGQKRNAGLLTQFSLLSHSK
jgi:hypothetical protein